MSDSMKRTKEPSPPPEASDDWIGPTPDEAVAPKKRKGNLN